MCALGASLPGCSDSDKPTSTSDAVDAAPRDAAQAEADAEAEADASVPLHPVQLIDNESWEHYPPEEDPLRDHQPPEIMCSLAGWFVERDALEVNTGECNYVLAQHPALVDVPEGAMVEAQLYYYDLIAPEPAVAHIAVLFGDDLQWETELDIPRPGNVELIEFNATRALSAGEPIRLHLHNHGQNTWLLVQTSVYLP